MPFLIQNQYYANLDVTIKNPAATERLQPNEREHIFKKFRTIYFQEMCPEGGAQLRMHLQAVDISRKTGNRRCDQTDPFFGPDREENPDKVPDSRRRSRLK